MKEGWTYRKLGEVCNVVGGGTPDTKNKAYWNGNIPWATVSDMNCDEIRSTGYYITDRGLNESSSRIIKSGEIIIATRVGLGKVCKLAVDTAINQDIKGIIPKCNSILRDFVFYFFKKNAKYIVDNGIGATVKGVKIKFIEGLSFGYPSLSEQQSIVDFLDSAFAKIDAMKANAEKALNEAKALFQASLKEMLEPKEGWEEKTLKEVSVIYGNYGLSVPSTEYNGVRYLRITDITEWGDLNDEKVSAKIDEKKDQELLEEGDILFARTGATVGKTLMYKESFGKCLFAGYLIRYRLNKEMVLPRYLFYITHSDIYYKWVLENQKAAAQPNISAKLYNEYVVSYPSIQEQQSIVVTLDSLKSKVDRLQENYDKISQECYALKQAILRQVFE